MSPSAMISPDFVLDLIFWVWSIAVAVKDCCWAKKGSGVVDSLFCSLDCSCCCCCCSFSIFCLASLSSFRAFLI